MNNKSLLIILIALVLLVVVAILVFMQFSPQVLPNEPEEVKARVLEFGSKLKNVSLQAPDVATQIRTNYSAYVTPELLAQWMQNPSVAPGRVASSPWPDRIEVISLSHTGETYSVQGNIIEITSNEVGSSNVANRIPIGMTIEKRSNTWLISLFSSQLTINSFKKQGMVTTGTPGLKAGVWYFTYEESENSGIRKELDLSAVTLPANSMHSGMVAYVEGQLNGNIIKVSLLEIKNAQKNNLIWVATPLPNEKITSPLMVTGRARGNWFFEASFPVKLLDATGRVISQGVAQAQGEWMTTDYVSFSVSIPFTKPTTATGTLVLEKDNPSGLPQNADELRVPVTF